MSGLYAAAGLTVGRELVLTGGMRADSAGHRPVAALRKLGQPRCTIVLSISMNIMTSPITDRHLQQEDIYEVPAEPQHIDQLEAL